MKDGGPTTPILQRNARCTLKSHQYTGERRRREASVSPSLRKSRPVPPNAYASCSQKLPRVLLRYVTPLQSG